MLVKPQLKKISSTASTFLKLRNSVNVKTRRQFVLFAKGWERRDSSSLWRESTHKQIYMNRIDDHFAAKTHHNEILKVMIGQRRARSTDATAANMDKENESQADNAPKRRSARLARITRSMAEDDPLSPEEPMGRQLPYIEYNGAIKYFTDGNEIAEAADFVMNWVDEQSHMELVPMAFDMEWPFSFQTGPGKSSVIQICVQEHCCYVFQLTNVKRLPAALMALLKHPKVRLHGVNIKNDFRKLARDFPEVNADVLIEKCIDLGVWCNEVCGTGGRWSLERLANFIVKRAMDKSKKVRMSKWHVIPLDENQLMYAAIDVYIGQVIYRELEQRHQIKVKNELEFKTKNGEAAFKVIKALGETFIDTNVKGVVDEKTTTDFETLEKLNN